jgi:hypothetical protein
VLESAVVRRPGTLSLRDSKRSRGESISSEKILLGGPSGSRGYETPVSYEHNLVVEMARGLLQHALGREPGYARFALEIADEDGAAIGAFAIPSAAPEKVQGPQGEGIEKDRQLADVDTLGDARMWARMERSSEATFTGQRPR